MFSLHFFSLPLALAVASKDAEAHAKAVRDVDELNEYLLSKKRPPYCLTIHNANRL